MAQTAGGLTTTAALQRPWPYVGAVALSLVTTPVIFTVPLFLGVVVGAFGALGGVFSRSDRGLAQGFRVLFLGLALLTGPASYLLLAVVN